VTEEERRERQTLAVDLDLFLDLSAAAESGDLGATIDYRDVCNEVRAHLEAGRFHLIEAVARDTLSLVLERFPAERAMVRVRKFVLPGVADVEVEMERRRNG
jgi:FolB domain-containing protein